MTDDDGRLPCGHLPDSRGGCGLVGCGVEVEPTRPVSDDD